jgi:hypothetical protein
MSKLIQWMENECSPKIPTKDPLRANNRKTVLPEGSKIIIVGGGISGSSMARELLTIAAQENISIEVILINSNTCNYCGGLITKLAEKTLREIYNLSVPANLILKEISTCVYITEEGSIEIDLKKKLIATLRTSKFGLQGFDDSIKSRITKGLGPREKEMLKIYEPTIVRKIEAPRRNQRQWRVQLSRRDPSGRPIIVTGDILVMASGFKSLNRPMMRDFEAQTGYQAPPLMPASVTEIKTDQAKINRIHHQILIVDHIVPGAVIGVIPKSDHWITVTSLGRELTAADVNLLFSAPAVKEYLDLPAAANHLRCQTICPAQVFTGPAKKFYGDGWVAIGDLTGYGRVLKDGYFASFLEAHLAAKTIFYHGSTGAHFAKHYHAFLKKFSLDNHFGMGLFRINLWLGQFPWFRKLFLAVGRLEEAKNPHGGFFHSSVRALATGELNYRLITLFFILGIFRALAQPFRILQIIRQKRAAS